MGRNSCTKPRWFSIALNLILYDKISNLFDAFINDNLNEKYKRIYSQYTVKVLCSISVHDGIRDDILNL